MAARLFEKISPYIARYRSSRAIAGAFWVVLGSGGSQGIRLVSNIILAYLLAPEMFGIMALAYTVIIGLGQISDVGLREGVVNSTRTEDPNFMRTAWTMQILRTTFMAILAIIIAYPFATFYKTPELSPVIVMIAISVFITGFKSISLLAYDKRLDLKTQIVSDLGIQVSGLMVTIVWAWISPSIWALVAGQVFSSVIEVVLSYVLFKGHHSKFAWETKAVKDLFHFGKWIVVSSTISFIFVQGDRLILGVFMSMSELGLYNMASTWSALVALISVNLSSRVLHPFFRQNLDIKDFGKIHRTRVTLNRCYALVCVILALTGEHIVIFIYDERYLAIGWMLQVLAVGQIGRVLTGTLRPFLLAKEDSFSQMTVAALSAVIMVVFIIIGNWIGGTPGVIIGFSLSGIIMHPLMIFFAHRHGYRCFISDMGLILGAFLAIVAGWLLIDAPVIDVIANLQPPGGF